MTKKTYQLPPLLVAALVTNRGILARNWASQQEDPEKENMARLLADLLDDRQRSSESLEQAIAHAQAAERQVRAAKLFLKESLAASQGIDSEAEYVVRSVDDDEGVFWNNEQGWVDRECATVFSAREMAQFNLPLGGEWVPAEKC